MYEQSTNTVSLPLLVMLICWLTVVFISFGLFAPFNATVVSSLIVAALSVSAAIFLIFEMYAPYSGVIQVSSAPLRAALAASRPVDRATNRRGSDAASIAAPTSAATLRAIGHRSTFSIKRSKSNASRWRLSG